MKKEEGISHNLTLNYSGCSELYFETKIKPVIYGLRDLSYEHLVVENVSDRIDYIQTIVSSQRLYIVEVKTVDNKFYSSWGNTKEQASTLFYKACVLCLGFDELSDFALHWHDYQKEEHMIQIVESFENKVLSDDDEAMYIEALQYLYYECGRIMSLQILSDYYARLGDDELALKYKKMANGEV